MPWIRAELRGTPVYVRALASGALAVEGGRVEIRYRPHAPRAYRANPANLTVVDATVLPDDTCGPTTGGEAALQKAPAQAPREQRGKAENGLSGAWHAWTDGACTGNPGPCGLGLVLVRDGEQSELSEYLGQGTNNVAELTAVLRALELVPPPQPLVIHTDSQYSIGVLQKGWKAKANAELVARIREQLASRQATQLEYTPGHAGVSLNERADQLARGAVATRSTSALRSTRPKR